ncbi:acireductone synthase [Sphaerospermopsis aphanizomenoides BCCUSP55]|uniref:acireductone synthase n=1 Tax=Sphaerospermopsis aphanizomenoides TaxID=459663 RepID=UPI000A728251|nr:acireductone synthase [Sphaerospermopsis aphanizomenoides]MBK1986549.1 acireductone synthase [Sphaerospermopsis aphanizomenoides BCCUSP55]
MTVTYQGNQLKVILTDIEGTTTDISFVHDVLFPYSAKHLSDWVLNHLELPITQDILQQVREINGQSNLDVESCLSQLMIWHNEDRKITPLKTLQGLIWDAGYNSGELKSHLYPDAFEYLQNWYAVGLRLAIYSSGSIAAQKLLFKNTVMGDLTPLFSMYFDTTTGNKTESQSYLTIADKLLVLPQEILFLSDSSKELAAAKSANFNVCGLNRQTTAVDNDFMYVTNFSQIPLEL